MNNVFHLIVREACYATFLTGGFLNRSIPSDFCPLLAFLGFRGSESVLATARFWWKLRGLELKIRCIKALSLESLLCWVLTGADANIERGLSIDSNDEEQADEALVRAFHEVSCGGY